MNREQKIKNKEYSFMLKDSLLWIERMNPIVAVKNNHSITSGEASWYPKRLVIGETRMTIGSKCSLNIKTSRIVMYGFHETPSAMLKRAC